MSQQQDGNTYQMVRRLEAGSVNHLLSVNVKSREIDMDKLTLKEYPFCDEHEDVQFRKQKHRGVPIEIQGMFLWMVECLNCGVETEWCFDEDAQVMGFIDGQHMARYKWNIRKGEYEQNTKAD